MGGQRARIKDFTHDNLLKETELKAELEAQEGQKAARQRKHNDWKKERCLLYAPILKLQKGVMVGGDEVDDEWIPGEPITSPCDSVTVSAL